jgi:hypothetical protein
VIVAEGGQHVIRDLDSRNGTYVNELPVPGRVLEDGDQIRIGESVFLFLASWSGAEGSELHRLRYLRTTQSLTAPLPWEFCCPTPSPAAPQADGAGQQNIKRLVVRFVFPAGAVVRGEPDPVWLSRRKRSIYANPEPISRHFRHHQPRRLDVGGGLPILFRPHESLSIKPSRPQVTTAMPAYHLFGHKNVKLSIGHCTPPHPIFTTNPTAFTPCVYKSALSTSTAPTSRKNCSCRKSSGSKSWAGSGRV